MLALMLTGLAHAQPLSESLSIVWERLLGDDKFDHEYKAAAILPQNDELVIAVRARLAGATRNLWNLLTWKVNGKGEKVGETSLQKLYKGEASKLSDIQALNVLRNGDIVVALVDNNLATLKRFHKEGDNVVLKPANSTMSPIYPTTLTIQGKVVGLVRKFY